MHHLEACFKACFPQEGARQGGPNPQEFVSKIIQELQESRVMSGSRRLPAVAPHPGEDGGLCVCIDIPWLKRAASQERLWPSRAGRCDGPPHNYVRMPYGLPNTAVVRQRLMRSILEAQAARHHAVLEEMDMDLAEPPGPPEPLEARSSKDS